jgi:DNA invertase Pin-like site-specific DNA recombinase
MSENHSTPLRGVVYARKSKEDQADSIEQQLAWAAEVCPRERVVVIGEPFTDEGKSGHATGQRTNFHAMLRFCQDAHHRGEPIDVIVCWHTNRFSRADSQETGWFVWEFRRAGVNRMLTNAGLLDFRDRATRVVFGIDQDFSANKFSEDLAETSTRGKLDRARAGRWCGGRVPYGYILTFTQELRRGRLVSVPDTLVIDPETAPTARWLFTSYATGRYSLRMLAEELNRRDELTPSARAGEKRAAARWTVPTIRAILTNEVYLGSLVWNRSHQGRFMGVVQLRVERRPGTGRRTVRNAPEDHIRGERRYEALADPDTFSLCQRRLREQRRNTTPKRGGGDLVLTGLLWCGHCGRRMVGRHKARGSAGGGPAVYLCGTYLQHGKSACNYNCLRQDALVGAVVKKIEAKFNSAFLEHCRGAIQAEVAAGRPAGNTDDLAKRLAGLEASLSRAARKVLLEEDEGLSAEYRKEAQALKNERDRLAAELATARRAEEKRGDPTAEVDAAMALVPRFREVMQRATPAERRAVLRDHVEKVELWFDHEDVGRETRCRFARGLIWLREDSPLAFCLSTSNR